MQPTFGRTNQIVPQEWLRLNPTSNWEEQLDFAIQQNTVLDVSLNPTLWGSKLRATNNQPVMLVGRGSGERGTDEKHAYDLTQAEVIEQLCSVGTGCLDYYFLPIERAWDEAQLNGALQALEFAKQDGYVRFIGLANLGMPLASLGLWQFRDAFDVLLIGLQGQEILAEEEQMLVPLAAERRLGIVTLNPPTFATTDAQRVRLTPVLEKLANESPIPLA